MSLTGHEFQPDAVLSALICRRGTCLLTQLFQRDQPATGIRLAASRPRSMPPAHLRFDADDPPAGQAVHRLVVTQLTDPADGAGPISAPERVCPWLYAGEGVALAPAATSWPGNSAAF